MANWPQFLVLGWLLFAAIYGAHKGFSRYGAFANIAGEFIGTVAVVLVLWAGGFFAPLGFAP